MRAVVQRVQSAQVEVQQQEVSSIGKGLLIFLGVAQGDEKKDALYLAEKIAHLRIFEDEAGKMNLSLREVSAEALVVSQFTLFGDCRKGRRPSFSEAADKDKGRALYQEFVESLRQQGLSVSMGVFQAHMEVTLVNDGPVTLLLDSKGAF